MKQPRYKKMILDRINYCLRKGYKATKIRPILEVGSGRFTQYSADHTQEYTKYLDELGAKYVIGNDAPNGGQLGKFIEIKIDKRNKFIRSLMEVKK